MDSIVLTLHIGEFARLEHFDDDITTGPLRFPTRPVTNLSVLLANDDGAYWSLLPCWAVRLRRAYRVTPNRPPTDVRSGPTDRRHRRSDARRAGTWPYKLRPRSSCARLSAPLDDRPTSSTVHCLTNEAMREPDSGSAISGGGLGRASVRVAPLSLSSSLRRS